MIGIAFLLLPDLAVVEEHDELPERRVGIFRHARGDALDLVARRLFLGMRFGSFVAAELFRRRLLLLTGAEQSAEVESEPGLLFLLGRFAAHGFRRFG